MCGGGEPDLRFQHLPGRWHRRAGRSIALRATPPFGTDPGFLAGQGIWLGASATLDVRGQALLVNAPSGLVSGDVLDGGTVSLHADRGFVNLLPGSIIDVSGTAASVDVANRGVVGGVLPARQLVPSNGGAIELQAAEGMQLQGTLKAAPGPVAGRPAAACPSN